MIFGEGYLNFEIGKDIKEIKDTNCRAYYVPLKWYTTRPVIENFVYFLNLCSVLISKFLRFELMTHSFGHSLYVKDYQINLLSVILYRKISK